MALPAQLLNAVSSPGGGKIAIVVGAGCSVEAPTCVPVERDCSVEVHRRLVANGVLQNGDCTDPTDLSLVADAVFEKKQSQQDVVELLRDQYDLKLAPPNDGYRIAAAMLCEGTVSSILTLNFDLALSNALSELGAGNMVGVIECPEDLPRQKRINVYYLHRNVNAADPESWVLRTYALNDDWNNTWCQVVTTSVLATPVVVFAGIGSPARVLIESAKLIRTVLPVTKKIFQIDPADRAVSKSFQELALDPGDYIQCGWVRFMEELSERLSTEQVFELEQAIGRKVQEEALLQTEDETGERAQNVIEALREAASAVVKERLREIGPLLQSIYARIDPHPSFGFVTFLSRVVRGKGELHTVVGDPLAEKECDFPAAVLSSSQVNALAVSVFLALNIGVPKLPLSVAILDDPLQSLDDIHVLGLVDLLRRTKDRRQLFVSTHDGRFGGLLSRKLRPSDANGRTIVIELNGWSRQGPIVVTRDVKCDPVPLRLVSSRAG